jgi:hypothetical protein
MRAMKNNLSTNVAVRRHDLPLLPQTGNAEPHGVADLEVPRRLLPQADPGRPALRISIASCRSPVSWTSLRRSRGTDP